MAPLADGTDAPEVFVPGASFVDQNAVGLSQGLVQYLARCGRGVVIGTVIRGRLDRIQSGVVIGTLVGVVIGTRRTILDGRGNVIGTFVADADGKDQTLRIHGFLEDPSAD